MQWIEELHKNNIIYGYIHFYYDWYTTTLLLISHDIKCEIEKIQDDLKVDSHWKLKQAFRFFQKWFNKSKKKTMSR